MKILFPDKLFLCAAAVAVGILSETKVHAQSSSAGWTNRYQGPGNSAGHSIAVDGDGNLFVTGYSFDRPLNSNGFPSPAFPDYATIKYSNTGVPLWTNRYDGPGNQYDEACAVAVDSAGNVLVTGFSYGGTNSHNDYATIKYSNAGAPLWTNRYNGPGNSGDSAKAVAVDGNDNVFVTGGSVETEGRTGYLTIKYSSAGVMLWANRYEGPINYVDIAYAIALDASGNVFVTGESHGNEGRADYLTIKYSNAGEPLWTNRYNGPASSVDQAHALAVDGSGDVIVTGFSWSGESSGSSDYLTIKYSGAGVPLWTNRYNGPGNDVDVARALTVDANGNVFVTGNSHSGNYDLSADYATIKYSSAGVPLWTNRYNGPGDWADKAGAIAVDGNGDVFVTGGSARGIVPWDFDYATIKYSSAGVPLLTNRYSGPGTRYDEAYAIAVDGSGNVFVTGQSWNITSYDYVTIKYSSAGGPLLSIACTTTNTLALSWPSPWTDFTLQQNTIVATTNWTPVGNTPADDGTNKTVIIDPPERNRFYRLFRP
jgi:uncharacterized delta-60 repeat protein